MPAAGDLDQTVTQRNTLIVDFSSSLTIIGGSSTRNLQTTAVTDLTLLTETVSSSGFTWLTESYTGFSYTPKLDSYASCGTTGTNCTFAFYAIELPVTDSSGLACRFTMDVTIDPITLPTIVSSQLYADFSGASLSATKAPLALLSLLAVPALFFLAL